MVTLDTLRTTSGMFHLLELDIMPYLATRLGLELPQVGGESPLLRVIELLTRKVAPAASGVIADPTWSLSSVLAVKPPGTGLAIRLDRPASTIDPQALPALLPEWGVEAVRHNYGAAFLSLWYHPSEPAALQKKQLVAELANYCRQENIAFVLKLQLQAQADQGDFATEQLLALQELRASADLFALQYPGDALSCATITAELDCPWVLICQETEYALTKERVREALENGAQGALLGAPLWSELTNLRLADQSPDWTHMESWITTEARDRAMELSRIINEYGGKGL